MVDPVFEKNLIKNGPIRQSSNSLHPLYSNLHWFFYLSSTTVQEVEFLFVTKVVMASTARTPPATPPPSISSIVSTLKAYSVPLIFFAVSLYFQLVVTPRSFPTSHYDGIIPSCLIILNFELIFYQCFFLFFLGYFLLS